MSNSRNNCNAIIRTKTNELLAGCKTSTIPSGVTSIHRWAFQWCTGLESVTIPQSVTKIGKGAFQFCNGLSVINSYPNPAEVEMGDGVFSLEVVNNCFLHVLPEYLEAYKAADQWKDFINVTADLSLPYDFMEDGLCYNVNNDGTSVTVTYQNKPPLATRRLVETLPSPLPLCTMASLTPLPKSPIMRSRVALD